MLLSRDIIKDIKKIILREEFIVLTGARQTGKTSLLILLKEYMEKNNACCYYLNLENPEYLAALNKHPFNIFDLIPSRKGKTHIFIDEVQYLNDPTNFLKLLYDEKRKDLKIIASGSSAFYIDEKFKDSLAGRKFLFEIFPLNFNEYLAFNNEDDLLKQKRNKLSLYYKKRLLVLWKEYLVYGGYPKIAATKEKDIKQILLEEIGSSYIKKDINDAGIKNPDKYFALLKILASQTGQLVNSQELSNTLNLAHKTIEEYLYVMKKSYQIAFIKPFYKNIRKELTKMPKAYFYDCGLRNYFLNNYTPIDTREDKGTYLENIAFREFLRLTKSIDKIKFWRTQDKNEVDFIIENKAHEIKFSTQNLKIKKYGQFMKEYPGIKLNFIAYEKILEKFYKWKV